MATKRERKVLPAQLNILIKELELDPAVLSSRGHNTNAKKLLHFEKWTMLAEKLNAVPNGVQKTLPKWQQFLRDWKANTKKKAVRAKSHRCKLSDVETRLIPFACKEDVREDSIDISIVNEADPLSSWSKDSSVSPGHVTEYVKDGESDDSSVNLKRKRVLLIDDENCHKSEDTRRSIESTHLDARVSALEDTVKDLSEKEHRILEGIYSVLERTVTATERQTNAAERQARAAEQQVEILARLATLLDRVTNKDTSWN